MIKYNFTDTNTNEDHQTIVESLTTLAKIALSREFSDYSNVLAKNYSASTENYDELNQRTKEKLLVYSAQQAGINDKVNVLTKEGLSRALLNQAFEWNFFAVQTQTLGTLLSDTEVRAMQGFVGLTTVGLGDSKTFYMGTKALYNVEDAAYGNGVTRPRKHFKQPVTITPSPKEASVQFDVVQMLTNDYDFGAEIAKIVVSIRTKQYQDAVDLLYTGTPILGTPFVSASFNLTNYTTLADRLSAVNGSAPIAFATRGAYRAMGATITTGLSTLDEINKQSFVSDLFGVPSRIIEQSVNTSNGNFAFRVPSTKVILIAGAAPIQMVQENYVSVVNQDGSNKNVASKVYAYTFSYGIDFASGDPYAIQTI